MLHHRPRIQRVDPIRPHRGTGRAPPAGHIGIDGAPLATVLVSTQNPKPAASHHAISGRRISARSASRRAISRDDKAPMRTDAAGSRARIICWSAQT